LKILLNRTQVAEGVARMADEINAFYGNKPLTIIGVLTGSIVLMSDLIRQLNMPLRVGVVQARSYRGNSTVRSELTIASESLPGLKGHDVLVVDDIFDTGHTMFQLLGKMQELGPKTLRSAVLLRKRGRQEMEMNPDHAAFEIPDEFVVGYGLDYNDQFRNLPYIAALEANEIAAGKTS
jgi:hypoxanthine phosphoribosyltransferase